MVKDKLKAEVMREIDEISNMELGSDEYSNTVKGAGILMDKMIELEKLKNDDRRIDIEEIKNDIESAKVRNDNRRIDIEEIKNDIETSKIKNDDRRINIEEKKNDIETSKIESEKKSDVMKYIYAGATFIIGAAITIWANIDAKEFEREDTHTTEAGRSSTRNLLSFLDKNKFKG